MSLRLITDQLACLARSNFFFFPLIFCSFSPATELYFMQISFVYQVTQAIFTVPCLQFKLFRFYKLLVYLWVRPSSAGLFLFQKLSPASFLSPQTTAFDSIGSVSESTFRSNYKLKYLNPRRGGEEKVVRYVESFSFFVFKKLFLEIVPHMIWSYRSFSLNILHLVNRELSVRIVSGPLVSMLTFWDIPLQLKRFSVLLAAWKD